MKKKIFSVMLATTLIVGFSSCNNEDDVANEGGTVSGKDTYMQVSITQPAAPNTYATTDPNSSEDESKFSSLDLYIYDVAANALEVHERLDGTTFTGSAGDRRDVWTATAKVKCKTGSKKILAALNITEAKGIEIANKGVAMLTSSETLFDVVNYGTADNALVDMDSNADTDRGIAMFSVGVIEANPVATTDPAYPNKVTIPVQRLVAKVTMQKADGLVMKTGGGKVTSMDFTLATTNLKTYLWRPWGAAGSGAVKDHNWDDNSWATTDFFAAFPSTTTALTDADYVTVDESGVAVKALRPRFCPENTSKNYLQEEVTAAVVRCGYIPGSYKKFTNDTNADDGFSDVDNAGAVDAVTFYTVTIPSGMKQYFIDETVATAYAAANTPEPAKAIKKYTDGYCYYRVYLNPKGAARKTTIVNNALNMEDNADNVVGLYDVIRNAFYKVNITKITAPGNPTPEPVNPEEPVAVPTDIDVVVEIAHWDLVNQDTELTPM